MLRIPSDYNSEELPITAASRLKDVTRALLNYTNARVSAHFIAAYNGESHTQLLDDIESRDLDAAAFVGFYYNPEKKGFDALVAMTNSTTKYTPVE